MKRSYHTIDKQGKVGERKLTEFLVRNGQALLPMLELIEQSRMAVDELIDLMGRASIESVLQLSALKGVFADVVEDPVTFVNAPLHAAERGVELDLVTSEESPEYRNLVTVRGTLAAGGEISVSGTLSGPRHIEKLVEIDGFDIDVVPTRHLAFLRYSDRTGVVGIVGQILGDADVNIAGMQVSRRQAGGEALMVLTVDSAIPTDALNDIALRIGATSARSVDLTTK